MNSKVVIFNTPKSPHKKRPEVENKTQSPWTTFTTDSGQRIPPRPKAQMFKSKLVPDTEAASWKPVFRMKIRKGSWSSLWWAWESQNSSQTGERLEGLRFWARTRASMWSSWAWASRPWRLSDQHSRAQSQVQIQHQGEAAQRRCAFERPKPVGGKEREVPTQWAKASEKKDVREQEAMSSKFYEKNRNESSRLMTFQKVILAQSENSFYLNLSSQKEFHSNIMPSWSERKELRNAVNGPGGPGRRPGGHSSNTEENQSCNISRWAGTNKMMAALKEAQTEGQGEKTRGRDPIEAILEMYHTRGITDANTHRMDAGSCETKDGKGKCFLPKEWMRNGKKFQRK